MRTTLATMTDLMIDEWTQPINVQSLLSFHTSNRGSHMDRLKAVIAHPYEHLSIITPPMTIYDANTSFRLNTTDALWRAKKSHFHASDEMHMKT